MHNYDELTILNKSKCITFMSIEPNQNDPTGMSDNIVIKHNDTAESIVGYNNLFNGAYITNISDIKPFYKRAYRSLAIINSQALYEQTGTKIKMSQYTRQFEVDWNNIVNTNNHKSLKIVGFNKKALKFTTNIPTTFDNLGKICGFAEIDIRQYMKTGECEYTNRYITNLSDVKSIIDKIYNLADKKKQDIIAHSDKIRNIDERNTAIFDTIKDILSKCAKEMNISEPYNDTGDSYSIRHTYLSKDDTFNYETTNTVTVTMLPKVIKIKYSLWVDSDTFNNEKIIEKTVPFKNIDSKDKMRKLVEQIVKSLKAR